MRTTIFTTLLAAATAVSATSSFSLSALEEINKDEVTPGCYKAYTASIEGCSASTSSCSEVCLKAIASADIIVREECAGAFVGMGSVLRRVVDGGILNIVCPPEIGESTMKAPALPTSTQKPSASSTEFEGIMTAAASAPPEIRKGTEAPSGILKDTDPEPSSGTSKDTEPEASSVISKESEASSAIPKESETPSETRALVFETSAAPTAGYSGTADIFAAVESGSAVETVDEDAAGALQVRWALVGMSALVGGLLVLV